jgi:hypothetical protein
MEQMTAEVSRLAAGLDISSKGLVLTLKSADARIARLLSRDARGRLDAELRLPGTTRASLIGHVGRVPLEARVGLSGALLELSASSTSIEPEAIRELFPAWPLRVPLRASAHAHGPLGAMQARVEGSAGDAKLLAAGTLGLSPEVVSELSVHAEKLDLQALDASAPSTSLDLDAQLRLAVGADGLTLTASGTLPESKLGAHTLPPLRAEVAYAKSKLSGNARLLEPRLGTDATFELLPSGKLTFGASARALELPALERFGVAAEGKATARVQGSLDHGELTVEIDTTLASPRLGTVRAENVAVRGRIEGPAGDPERLKLTVTATGRGLDVSGLKLRTFEASSRGTVGRQAWLVQGASDDGGTLEVSANVLPRAGPAITELRVVSRRGKAEATIEAKRVALDPAGVNVAELSLHAGNGDIRGSIAARRERRTIDLTITNLDVSSLLAAFGLARGGAAGRIDGRVELEERGSERTGHARFELTGGALPPLEGITVLATSEFAGSDVKAHAELGVHEMVSATLDASGRLERSVLDPDALHALGGEATLVFSDLELERLGKTLLAATGVELAGRAEGKLRISRLDPEGSPTFSYELATHGLSLAKQGKAQSGVSLDIDSAGELFTPKGSRIALELVDAQGPWVAANIEHALGPTALAHLDVATFERALLDAPFNARVTAYRRPIKMLGVPATSALEGSVAGVVVLTGTARTPDLEASIDVIGAPSGANAQKPQLAVSLRYSAARETYALEAHTAGEPRIFDLTSTGHLGWLAHGFGKDWSAAGQATIQGLELVRVARLIDVPLQGTTNGRFSFDIDPRHIEAKAELELASLSVDQHPLGTGSVRLNLSEKRAELSARLGPAASALELLGQAGIIWGEGGLLVDRKQPGVLRVTAREFDLAALGPLARGSVRQVSGHLNGRAEVDWGGTNRKGKASTTLRANASVRDGTASLVAGGGLLQNIDVQALADGDGPLRLTFSAAARSRKPNVKGSAAISLEGPRLKRLDAKIELDSFPLLYDGILMGRATTGANAPPLDVAIASTEAGQTVDVSIPALEVKLPESSDKTLITLDDDPAVQIRDTALEPEEDNRKAGTDGGTILKVRLGQKFIVKRGALEVPVRAELTVLPNGRLDGSVTLPPGGVVPALGQTFRIKRGVITFKQQEPEDGSLAIEASTRAADGTLIELAVSGTVREPDVRLRSDPPRSQNEIVALLLGIQPNATNASDGDALGRTAMALAMNRLVEGSALSGLQFGAGKTTEGEAVSSVSMRVADKIWVEGRTVKGSSTSINQDERVSGVVDWRFAPSWSLRTQLGGISGVELRWSLSY